VGARKLNGLNKRTKID